MITMAVGDAANEAIVAEIKPWSRDFNTTWALAWRARSAAWMVRHRELLQRAAGEPAG
jgi:hypothetical protein